MVDVRSKKERVWYAGLSATVALAEIRWLDPSCFVQDEACERSVASAEDETAIQRVGGTVAQEGEMGLGAEVVPMPVQAFRQFADQQRRLFGGLLPVTIMIGEDARRG